MEEKKQMNHTVLYLTNSLTGIGDMTAESKSWGPGFLLPGFVVLC